MFYKEKNIDLAKEFILDYDKKCQLFLKNTDDTAIQTQLFEKFKEFGYINEEKELWNFDWFFTFCEKYDPYENIVINQNNCKTLFDKKIDGNENCIKRHITNPTNLGISESDADYSYFLCDSPIFTSKLSILNIDKNSEKLKDWLLNINYFTEDKLKLSNLICIDKQAQINRVL